MTLRIALCDDENDWINHFEEYFIKYKRTHKDVDWDIFYSAEDFLKYYYDNGSQYDVLITDIEMGSMNGIDLANSLYEIDKDIKIFFLTNYEKYVRKCFDCRPVNFWDKSTITYNMVQNALEKIISELNSKSGVFKFKSGEMYMRLPYTKILYFATNGRKLIVHTTDRDYDFYGSFKQYIDIWKNNGFYSVNRFYCVNTNAMVSLKDNNLILYDETKIALSAKNKKSVKELFFENDCKDVIDKMKYMKGE